MLYKGAGRTERSTVCLCVGITGELRLPLGVPRSTGLGMPTDLPNADRAARGADFEARSAAHFWTSQFEAGQIGAQDVVGLAGCRTNEAAGGFPKRRWSPT